MYCTKCGKAIPEGAYSCPSCGNMQNQNFKKEEKGNIILNIISFIIPIIGLLIWLIYKNTRPKVATQALLFAFISVLLRTIRWMNLF